jgi:predicted DNA-binding transcriptional regulator AlpA
VSEHTERAEGATPLNDLLTVREAAQATGHTAETLNQYRALRNKGLNAGPVFVKVGRAVFYTRAAIEAYSARRGV